MRFLRIYLVAIFVTLILLLLLRYCSSSTTESDLNPDSVGGMGRLKVTLVWNFVGDIDLHVKEPCGNIIWWQNKRNRRTGGYLDNDNIRGGRNSVENVFWETPPAGEYVVSLEFYEKVTSLWRDTSGDCRVYIYKDGVRCQEFTVPMNHVGDKKVVTTISID